MTVDSRLLMDIAQAVLTRSGGEDWKLAPGEFWCMAAPDEHPVPGQGWKMHVSATLLAAPIVLAASAEVLVRERCAFKFTRGLKELGELLSPHCERGRGGKFITVYPLDDEQFRRVAHELDQATDGLPGPRVLSDRRLRPGSNVYYRYGVISSPPVLTAEGIFESMLTDPQGQLVKDERTPFFRPPPWAVPPLPQPYPATTAESRRSPRAMVIGGRFVVRAALRHAYRGGVFQATDTETGADVVLKQARPHVMCMLTGEDAQDMLRHEAHMCELLGPLGLAPRKIALVPAQENLFLAEEWIPGDIMPLWVQARASGEWQGRGAPVDEAIAMARQVTDIVAAVHEQGLILRDLKPANLMITPDGVLRLIDPETVVEAGSRIPKMGTQGYCAPEQESAPWFGAAPAPQADLFSLGATIMFLASGIDPLPADDPAGGRVGEERLGPLLAHAARHMAAVDRLSPLIRGLMRDMPGDRWDLSRARAFLEEEATAAGDSASERAGGLQEVPGCRTLEQADVDRLIGDGLRYIVGTMTPDEPHLWKARDDARISDPCAVYHGAAGVLGLLTEAARHRGHDELSQAIATTAAWIDKRLTDIPRLLPGMYAGRSGTAWAVYDAACMMDDQAMATRAVDLAKRIPVRWPNLDVISGTAGTGLALLRLMIGTRDPELRDRTTEAADAIRGAAWTDDGQLCWPARERPDRESTAHGHYAFGHGIAGMGTFLLYSALATGRGADLEGARRVGDALIADAVTDGEAAWWPTVRPDNSGHGRHWCDGASGIGTFLIRLWAVTGEHRYRDLAQAAAITVYQGRWYTWNSACHGLAGDGDFLLDLADLTADQRYRDWAWELAQIMHGRHVRRDGLVLLADDSRVHTTARYSTGMAGALAFLLRLRYSGSRLWMLDDLLDSVPSHGKNR